MTADPSEEDLELARLRERTDRQEEEIAELGAEARSVQALGGRGPSEVVEAVTTEVRDYARSGLSDDLCVVAARVAD